MSSFYALLLHPQCLFPAYERCGSTDIMKPCLAIYMQSSDKEKDINWNDSQFTERDLIAPKAAGCGCVRLLCREKKEACTYMHTHNLDT